MFNMGITGASSFNSEVSKDIAGKNFHNQLSHELEKFLETIIDKFGGVIGCVDLYCMYNRARGTDLISPEDLNIACQIIDNSSSKFMVKIYASGVHTIQSSKCIQNFKIFCRTIQREGILPKDRGELIERSEWRFSNQARRQDES